MVTDYQRKVYEAARKIPLGRVSTYSRICALTGMGSPLSTGQALKKNPFAPGVPCHRIIRSDMTIGGFCGKTTGAAIGRKLKLLKDEGVLFYNGRLIDSSRLWP